MNLKMKKEYLLVIPLILVLVIWGVLLYNYFGIKKVSKLPTVKPPTEEQPTLNPTEAAREEKIEEVKREGGTVPFDYEVISANGDRVELTGLKGKLTLTNRPTTKVYFKKGDDLQEASFADLKVGQKLVLELSPPPNRTITIYIVSQ